MLETLLHIGKVLRESKRLRHHRYIKLAPKKDKKTDVVYLVLPVNEDFSFDFDNLRETTNEYLIEKLLYLTYKSSDSDSVVKYIWGDISYGIDKNGKELGWYRISDDASGSAFGRVKKDEVFFAGTLIEKFRRSFDFHRQTIEAKLIENSHNNYCYLHFDFQGKHWYEFDQEMQRVNEKFLDDFSKQQSGTTILKKSLFKTLASAEKNLPFPQFSEENIYKTRMFSSQDEIKDLFFAINYSTRAVVRERDIKVVVLPKGKKVNADHIEEFFERRNFAEQADAEEKIIEQNKVKDEFNLDDFFAPVVENVAAEIVEFDFVFSKAGGMTAPDVDMVEISGIKRSLLAELAERTNDIRQRVEAERERVIGKSDKLLPLSIKRSFLNILGDVTKDKKKYQSHLLKVLPQIYSGTYYKDAVLLPAFIEKTEYNIRQEKPNFNLLKFDYEFLVELRNKNGDKTMKDMKNSASYKVGKLLGELAQPVSWEIKSFEKNYVGLLARRISDLQGLIAFSNFINQKLAIHERTYPSLKEKFGELAALLGEINQREYDRDFCAFGFFEGYFKRFEKPAASTETVQLQGE